MGRILRRADPVAPFPPPPLLLRDALYIHRDKLRPDRDLPLHAAPRHQPQYLERVHHRSGKTSRRRRPMQVDASDFGTAVPDVVVLSRR